MNTEELRQDQEIQAVEAPATAAEAPAEAPASLAVEGKAAKPEGSERWHAVTSDGLLSAHNKNGLKKKLNAVPAAKLVGIIRGKKLPLQTAVSF